MVITLKSIAKKNGIILLLILAASSLFYNLAFRVQQLVVRQKMKEKLETQVLHVVTIAEKDLQWEEKGKEILVNGELFDVQSYVFINGYYSFIGLSDKEETALVNQLKKTTQTASSNDKILGWLFQWLQFVYDDSPTTCKVPDPGLNQKNLLITPTLPEQYLGIILPPPKTG